MLYVSTRGHPDRKRFCEILLEGLAPDGGLYLPESYPKIDAATLAKWRGLPYHELAFQVLSLYIDDIPAADLKAICARTYTADVFGTKEIVPLKPLAADDRARGNGHPRPERKPLLPATIVTGQPEAASPLDVAAQVPCPVLLLYGGADQGIPLADVDAEEAALKAAGRTVEKHVYPGVGHAFFADYRPSYNADAAKDGWERCLAWFQKHVKA